MRKRPRIAASSEFSVLHQEEAVKHAGFAVSWTQSDYYSPEANDNRCVTLDRSALELQSIDRNEGGVLTEFLETAEVDRHGTAVLSRFRANTQQMQQWLSRLEQSTRRTDRSMRARQLSYDKELDDIEHGALQMDLCSRYRSLHRRMKADVLGLTSTRDGNLVDSSAVSSPASRRPSSAPACRGASADSAMAVEACWPDAREYEFKKLRGKVRQTFGKGTSDGQGRWNDLAMAELTCGCQKLQVGECGEEEKTKQAAWLRSFGSKAVESIHGTQVAESEARVTAAVLEEHEARIQEQLHGRRRYLTGVVQRQRQEMRRSERARAEKQAVIRNREDGLREVKYVRALLRAREQGKLRSASAPLLQNGVGQQSPGATNQHLPVRRVDTRPAYTGGPGGCWRPPLGTRDRQAQESRAAIMIQRHWRFRQCSWNGFVSFNRRSRTKQAAAEVLAEEEKKRKAEQAQMRLIAQRAEYRKHPERFVHNDDACLVHCASIGDVLGIKRLWENVNLSEQGLRLALFAAARANAADVMLFLLRDAGCRTDWRESRMGWTPLHAAAVAGCLEACAVLERFGADASALDRQNRKPCEVAVASVADAVVAYGTFHAAAAAAARASWTSMDGRTMSRQSSRMASRASRLRSFESSSASFCQSSSCCSRAH